MSASVDQVTGVRRSTWTVLYWAAGLCLLAIAFRYLVIEFRPVALQCDAAPAGIPWWCGMREFIIGLFYSDAVGIASLVAAGLAFVVYTLKGSRFLAAVAMLAAAPAVILYSADYAAPAFLLATLRLLRD